MPVFSARFKISFLYVLFSFCAFAQTPVFAADIGKLQAESLSVSRLGDLEMACGSLSEEAVTMRDIVNATQDIKNDSDLKSRGVSAAGAVGSFVVGTVTGGLGFAAAGFLLDQQIDSKSDNAESTQDIAIQRRSLMMGIFNAKGCFGPIEHALQDRRNEDSALDFALLEPSSGEDTPKDAADNTVPAHNYNN